MKITVVITTYQLEAHLAACLDGLFAQTEQDFRILIVDDCSRDRTPEIIRSYQAAHPDRIEAIFLSENRGSSSKTRNIALDSGRIDTKYTLFLDGDDVAEENFLQVLLENAEKSDADMSVCAYDRVEIGTGHVLCREMESFCGAESFESRIPRLPYVNTSLWNKLIRTDLIGATRFPEFRIGEDMCFLWRLFSKRPRMIFTDQILFHYQVRSDSLISNTSEESIRLFAQEIRSVLQALPEGDLKEVFKQTAMIHIGISMLLRANDNKEISNRAHIRWTHAWLTEQGIYRAKTLRFIPLLRQGFKGFAIWVWKWLFRTRLMRPFLKCYGFLEHTLHFSVKF